MLFQNFSLWHMFKWNFWKVLQPDLKEHFVAFDMFQRLSCCAQLSSFVSFIVLYFDHVCVFCVLGQPQMVVNQQPVATVAPMPAALPPANDPAWENVKKCKNFLSTLIKLASNQPATTVKNVRLLIQGLIVSFC